MIDLSSYNSVKTALFVKIEIDEYRTSPSEAYGQTIIAVSDHDSEQNINGTIYQNVGSLLGVTRSRSELRPTGSSVTITLSGIPNTALQEILYSKIKGSPVRIYRGFFEADSGLQIGIQSRFRGFVNNFSLEEDYNVDARTASNTIDIECSSTIDVLQNKFAGRRTNPESEKSFFPNDLSMDRVPNLENATFDFGAPT